MTPHMPNQHEIETFSGAYIDVLHPQAETICVQDIAHHLSQINRFSGAAAYPYSVAQHAVFVAQRMLAVGAPRGLVYAGLHHDDAEAFLQDIPRPLKPLLGDAYVMLTKRMDEAIRAALRRGPGGEVMPWLFEGDLHCREIVEADNYALLVEAGQLLPSKGIHWQESWSAWRISAEDFEEARRPAPDYWLGQISPVEAEGLFLSMHHELTAPYRPAPSAAFEAVAA